VSLRDRQQWQPGDERFSVFFDGRRYQFATPRERDIFAAAPVAYAPVLRGDCPVTFAETGRRERGRLEFGVLHRSRLMFFASEDDRRYFLEDPSQFNNVDLALGGRCIVSRRDLNKDVAGIPESVAVYGGMRHLFASAHDRALFLRNPARYDGSAAGDVAATSEPPETPLPDEADEQGDVSSAPWLHSKSDNKETRPLGSSEEDIILSSLPAMTGYCPVTLRKEGAWVRGRYEYRVELGEHVFLTAGPRERDALTGDPARYMPALGGDCPVTLVARGERVRGSVYHAYEYEDRLFLFADAERKAIFKASPARYTTADLAADGMCVVTEADERREAPGLIDHATWHAGKLYRFAGAEQKAKFLAKPDKYAED
jgi:YHS domain-containing protein